MNIYFCHHKSEDCGCYVAADTIGKAKALYAKWDGMENFTEYRGHVMRKDVERDGRTAYCPYCGYSMEVEQQDRGMQE